MLCLLCVEILLYNIVYCWSYDRKSEIKNAINVKHQNFVQQNAQTKEDD